PLGMVDTDFWVPPEKRDRFATSYRPAPDGSLQLADRPDGIWGRAPAFPSGAGGLVCTARDWYRFGRMLLDGGRPLLSEGSVRLMTTDHLTAEQRAASTL